MQPIQHPLAAQQTLVVEVEREGAFQPRLVFGLLEQIAQLAQLSLEVEFPVGANPRYQHMCAGNLQYKHCEQSSSQVAKQPSSQAAGQLCSCVVEQPSIRCLVRCTSVFALT
jgi:hypothetical protein